MTPQLPQMVDEGCIGFFDGQGDQALTIAIGE